MSTHLCIGYVFFIQHSQHHRRVHLLKKHNIIVIPTHLRQVHHLASNTGTDGVVARRGSVTLV